MDDGLRFLEFRLDLARRNIMDGGFSIIPSDEDAPAIRKKRQRILDRLPVARRRS